MTQNRLDDETSPYLLQHRDNPVHWQAWGPEALQLARQEGRPILLSVGYAACHWCHVMAHESFENPAIAELMNTRFINIKVDREERPDLDAIYQRALALLGEQGGWPLTMFLTPEGEPFWGGTYFPPTSKFGRPGFPDVLSGVADFYHASPDKISESAGALRSALGELARSEPGGQVSRTTIDEAALRFAGAFDPAYGGLRGAPKFPNPSILELVWRGHCRTGEDRYRDCITLALDKMSGGGIYDHLGGGYARYSTDEQWLAPHFEKMLYDNAQLIDLLTWGWQKTRSPVYEARIRETIGWAFREMIADGGGFAASLDADSEGVEGKFYVWSEREIDDALGAGAAPFKQAYDVSAAGNWEGHNILNRNHPAGDWEDDAAEMRLAGLRDTLLKARAGRVRPGWDDKVLADWNGLMIAALAGAGAAFAEPAWTRAAERAFQFVQDNMASGPRLLHSYRKGQARHMATLDDYAAMIRAGLTLYEVTGTDRYLAAAMGWVATLDQHFWDEAHGGYFFTADDAEALIVRARHAHDNATPAGNGVMAASLARLYYLTGDTDYRDRAESLIGAFSGELERDLFPFATLINAADFLADAVQIIIVGARGTPATDKLATTAWRASCPNKVIQIMADTANLTDSHPAAGKPGDAAAPKAYVCTGQVCSEPVSTPETLIEALGAAPQAHQNSKRTVS